jgi:hypothetical protein
MPTINQLQPAALISAGDRLPTQQVDGVTRSATLSQITAAIVAPGAPVTGMLGTDLVQINQGGVNQTISLTNLLNGQTIDQGSAAAPAADTDTFWVGQGTSTMLRQSLSGVWAWVQGHMPGYRLPVVEVNTSISLDGSAHNGHLLICSQPVTLLPSGTMGSGFFCQVVNVSSGGVTLGSGIISSSGSSILPTGQCAQIVTGTYSLGTVVFAAISGTGGASATPAAPGLPTGLTSGTKTSTGVALTWTAPATGGSVVTYTLQWRLTGGSTWTQITGVPGTAITVSGLTAATGYDFQVQAVNGGGVSGFTATTSASTVAGAGTTAPFNSGGYLLTMGTRTVSGPLSAGAVGLIVNANDNSAAADGSFTAPASVSVGWSTSNTVAPASGLQTLSPTSLDGHNQWVGYVAGPTSVGSFYLWFIATSSGGGIVAAYVSPTAYAVVASGTIPGVPTGLIIGTATSSALAVGWTAPSTGVAATGYVVQSRVTGTSTWTQSGTITGTSTTLSGLTPSTSYDVQVKATNSSGSSAFTGTTTGWTIATSSGGSCTAAWNIYQTALTHGTTGNIYNLVITSGTAPASVAIGISSSATVAPSPMPAVADGPAANFNGNVWGTYVSAPATTGTFYGWAIGRDGSGVIMFTLVGAAVTVT